MSQQNMQIDNPQAPPQVQPPGNPGALNQARDLVAERDQEAAKDRSIAKAKESRFKARTMVRTEVYKPGSPEFETLILKSAVNNPLATLVYPAVSTYVPNFAPLFYLINYMDFLMASTKRWVDNCMGWAPPISQMYLGVLVIIQSLRAADTAGAIAPGSDIALLLQTFMQVFPLNELWIPGPLIAAFRAISAFWPSASDRFGNVTASIGNDPGNLFTAANLYRPTNTNQIPNINWYIHRMRSICGVAQIAGITEPQFATHVNGPNYCRNIFGANPANNAAEHSLLSGPGCGFISAGSLQLWKNAAAYLAQNQIPTEIQNRAFGPLTSWTDFIRFVNGEHSWFGPVSAIMAKYCQFFRGSVPLSECHPTSSAAGAVKCTYAAATNINAPPAWHAQAGNHNQDFHGHADQVSHYDLRNSATVVINAALSVEDVPDAHVFTATTYGINCYDPAQVAALRNGNFWLLAPDCAGRNNIEVLPGVLATIMREYHSDVRIDPAKQ